MVTVYIDKDEWYPVYSARLPTDKNPRPYGDPAEVDGATVERWGRVFAEFDKVQDEIADLYDRTAD